MLTTKQVNDLQSTLMSEYGSQAKTGWNYFISNTDTVPIFRRTSISPLKQDSLVNVHSDFMGVVVEQKVGYIGAVNVYLENNDAISDSLLSKTNTFLEDFQKANQSEVKAPETIRWTAAEGLSHRIMYLKNGKPRIKNLHGWQVLYDFEDDIYNPDAAFVFYRTTDVFGKTEERMDVYTSDLVEYYYKFNNKWQPRVPEGKSDNTEQHFMGRVPVFPVFNNEMHTPDCPKSVVMLIDAYDETQSDVLSELKASRLAFLKIWGEPYTGYRLDSEGNFQLDGDGNKIPISIPEYMREFGALVFKTDDDGKPQGDAQFLLKQMDDAVIEHNLDRLREQVFQGSQAVDERTMLQGANQRVIAIKSAYDKLDKKCQTFEKYFTSALRVQYEILFTLVLEKMLPGYSITQEEYDLIIDGLVYMYDHADIVDPEIEARVLSINLQNMSRIDAYSFHPLITDPVGMSERYQEEIESGLYLPGMEPVIAETVV